VKPLVSLGFVSKRAPALRVAGVERQRAPRSPASCGVAALHHSHPQQVWRQSLAILLLSASAAAGRPALFGGSSTNFQPAGRPHPAVVRVIVPDGTGASYGSGALVAVNAEHGLVVTNWHVVRDARGQIVVAFADGFRSGATVLATDRDWDLAALAIWRPNVDPIPLAARPPVPGETLSIAGYGKGSYRAAAGRCTQYVSPGRDFPPEMIELSAAARDGDSGGPILNSRGELAGVLFGAAWGHTTGSHCGRVSRFLSSVADEFQRLGTSPAMIARQSQKKGTGPICAKHPSGRSGKLDLSPFSAVAGREQAGWRASDDEPASGRLPVVSIPAVRPLAGESNRQPSPVAPPEAAQTTTEPQSHGGREHVSSQGAQPLGWEDIAGSTRSEQIKTILAAVGVLAIVFHGLRLASKAQGS